MSVSSDVTGDLCVPPDSPGSSVSTRLQEEYDELLKYAVIVPTSAQPAATGSFPLLRQLAGQDSTLQDVDGKDDNTLEGTVSGSDAVDDDQGNDGDDERDTGTHVHVHQYSSSTPRDSTPVQELVYKASTHSQDTKRISEQFRLQEVRQFDQVMPPLSLNQSVASSRYTEDPSQVVYTAGVDPDIARMESMLDQWTLDLKRNVLAEYSQSKIKNLEQHKQEMMRMKERHNAEKNQLHNEIDSMKELLHTYEQSIQRKDQVITNLTDGLQKQKEKHEMLRSFCEWKIRHNDCKKEAFASNLAARHYDRCLKRRAYLAWHSVIENNWRARVEKACQVKAQEVCLQLTNEYETTIAQLNNALAAAKEELANLGVEREIYEDNMKKAFMRGVCALNMEAMAMFSDDERGTSTAPVSARESEPDQMHTLHSQKQPQAFAHPSVESASSQMKITANLRIQPVEQTDTGILNGAHLQQDTFGTGTQASTGMASSAFRVANSNTMKSSSAPNTAAESKSGTIGPGPRKPKSGTSQVKAKVDTGRGRVGVPSVVVERHPPVNKETIGQATASQYAPKSKTSMGRKTAANSVHVRAPHLQTIKLVE